MNKYQVLFEVKFYHQYYEGYTAKDFDILLGPGTSEILSGYSLMYRSTPEGFVVLYSDDKKFLLEKLRERITFTFGIKSRNNHFETFTNIKPINNQQKYFFDNQNPVKITNDVQSTASNKFRLHAGEFVNLDSLARYGYAHSNIKKVLDADEVSINYEGNIIFDGVLKGSENFASMLKEGHGWYDVTVKPSNEKSRLYYLSASLEKALGVVDIAIGGTEAIEFNQMKGREFHIRFENRSVLWNYYFVSEVGKYFEVADVFSGKAKLSFTPPEQVMLVNGQTATKVTSQNLIPLEQRFSGKQIQAELREQSTEAGFADPKRKINLPTPNVLKIKGMKQDDRELYFSEMFVYV